MSQGAIIRVREMLKVGQRLTVESATMPLQEQHQGEREVVSVHLNGIMTRRLGVEDPEQAQSFIPVGCTVGRTDAELLPNNGFELFFPGRKAETTMVYRLSPTTFWSLIRLQDKTLWQRVQVGEDFNALADHIFELVSVRSEDRPQDWIILAAEYIRAHPALYPIGNVDPSELAAIGEPAAPSKAKARANAR